MRNNEKKYEFDFLFNGQTTTWRSNEQLQTERITEVYRHKIFDKLTHIHIEWQYIHNISTRKAQQSTAERVPSSRLAVQSGGKNIENKFNERERRDYEIEKSNLTCKKSFVCLSQIFHSNYCDVVPHALIDKHERLHAHDFNSKRNMLICRVRSAIQPCDMLWKIILIKIFYIHRWRWFKAWVTCFDHFPTFVYCKQVLNILTVTMKFLKFLSSAEYSWKCGNALS